MLQWLKSGGFVALLTIVGIGAIVSVPAFIGGDERPSVHALTSVVPLEAAEIDTKTDELKRDCAGQDAAQCLQRSMLELVPDHGPKAAMDVLARLLQNGTNVGSGDHHDFVHKIGRATAKAFGVNADAFFECPLEFNYGCPHGFFEQALVEAPDAKQAALNVCDRERMKDKPLKFFFYCYHGVGHGVMMAKAYDVKPSLDVCNGFEPGVQQIGCWQGVFMENTNSYGTSTMRANAFSADDILYPCNSLEDKYLWECYLNHAGYLVNRLGPSAHAAEVSAACLPAKEPGRTSCLQGIGLMSTNADWQLRLVREDKKDLLQNAVSICMDFPEGRRDECVIGGVDNLANFDKTDTRRMLAFCAMLPDAFQSVCHRQIGRAVRNEVPADQTGERICDGVPEVFKPDCRQGAGLAS